MLWDATAAVLAGGRSTRMGRDKALLPWRGMPLAAHVAGQLRTRFTRTLVSANDPGRVAYLGLEVVPDLAPGQGPLSAVAACLKAARHERVFVAACDIPEVDPWLIARLMEASERSGGCAVPCCAATGRLEPLFAVYARTALPAAEALLASGGRAMHAFIERVPHCMVLVEEGTVGNVNTPEDVLGG